jgi:secondary thiamine-phosphate synthase enzyme
MKVFQKEFTLRTEKRVQALEITEKIEKIVGDSKVENGICMIFLPHATAALILEEAEPRLISDIENNVQRIFPKDEKYAHNIIDDNADSHLASGFIGQSRIYPIKDGKIVCGTWQQPILLELDGPRTRRVFVTVMGE